MFATGAKADSLRRSAPCSLLKSVWPSGAARATWSAARSALAPGRFSTTAGWPTCHATLAATTRVTRSAPSLAKPTTQVRGFDGKFIAALRVRSRATPYRGSFSWSLTLRSSASPRKPREWKSASHRRKLGARERQVLRGPRHVADVLDPAAAERPVEIHEVRETPKPRRDERLLRAVKVRLRGEHVEVTVDARAEAKLGELERRLLRRDFALEGDDLVVVRAARCKAVRHLAERALDRLLVLRDRGLLLDLCHVERCLERAALEDRHADRRHEAPGLGLRREELIELRAFAAEGARQADGREERGARRADVRVRAAQVRLRLHDVRPPRQQIGRQARGDVGDQPLRVERQSR